VKRRASFASDAVTRTISARGTVVTSYETRGHRTQGERLAMNQKTRHARRRSGSHTALHRDETVGRHGQRVDPALNEELREFRTESEFVIIK
jgi:hypothetical protein